MPLSLDHRHIRRLALLRRCRLGITIVVFAVTFSGCRSSFRSSMASETATPGSSVEKAATSLGASVSPSDRQPAPLATTLVSRSLSSAWATSAMLTSPGFAGDVVALRSSSGDWLSFRSAGGLWYAETGQGALPVVGQDQTGVGSYLSWLRSQERSVVRSRVHVIPRQASPSGSPCVYLGKLGLLGGGPKREVEWVSGPHMDISSEDERIEPYYIPAGYRFKDYRIKPGSVAQRASCTIRYVGADSEEEIQRLLASQGGISAEGHLSASVPNVVTLGNSEGGIRHARLSNQRSSQRAYFKHAALVLYGKTKRNKLLRPKSKIHMTLEVGLVEAGQSSATQESQASPTQAGAQEQLQSQIKRLQSQYDAQLSMQTEIQRQLSSGLSEASSARVRLEAQIEEFKKANASLSSEKETLTSQLASLKQASNASTSDTASLSSLSLGDDSSPVVLVSTEDVPVAVEIVDASSPSVLDPLSTAQCSALHARKQENPLHPLSASESIDLLNMYIAEGLTNARRLTGKEAIVVLGNTGAGKSTFLNYLMGCEMMLKDPEELGLDDLDDEVVVVRSRSEGGPLDEIMEIGHGKQSKTFLPHIEVDPRQVSSYAYCDCPGFLDNRWPEVNIANAVNIRRALQEASSVRLLILINYNTLKVDKGRGLSDMLRICTQLFGSSDRLRMHKDSVLLGITHVPRNKRMDKVRKFLLTDSPTVLASLTERMFFYDPLEEGGEDFSTRAGCRSLIAGLKPLKDAGRLFHTVLTDSDERMLRELTERQCAELEGYLSRHEYESASKSLRMLQRLQVIDNLSIERLLQRSHARVVDHITRMEMEYQRSCHFHDFVRAERMLGSLTELNGYFSGSAISLDLPDVTELRGYMNLCKQRADEAKREREERAAERARAARDKQQLLEILERQRQETVTQLAKMREDNARQQAAFEQELRANRAQHEGNVKRMEEEYASLRSQKEEALSLVEKLNVEEKRRLAEEIKKLSAEYQAKLEAERQAHANSEVQYQAQLLAVQQQQQASEQELSSVADSLAHQHASETAQLASLRIPEEAFGAKAWSQYFGEVGGEPSLPADINTTLNAACPFWRGKQVKDTHLLVLIPAKVNGKPYSLNLLSELIQHPKGGGHATQYRSYGSDIQKQFGTQSPGRSYWALMTRDVLEGSRNKTYANQKDLVSGYAKRTQLPYELPGALEAATAMLSHHVRSGERLYAVNPRTYTRCRELEDGKYPVVVGGFSSGGLFVDRYDSFGSYSSGRSFYGVAGFRKF